MRQAHDAKRLDTIDGDPGDDLLAEVPKATSAPDRAGGIALAGGNTPADIAVRHARREGDVGARPRLRHRLGRGEHAGRHRGSARTGACPTGSPSELLVACG